MRTAKSIVDEFEYLTTLGFYHILIIDDTMTANLHRLNLFLDELIHRNLNVTWYCESRVDIITRDMLIKMKAAGLTQIQFGVESGNQDILKSIKKNITLEQIRNAFKWCEEIGIIASTNMIIGHPEDTLQTINETILFAQELQSLGARVSFTICTPFPGTPIWNIPEEYGLEIIDNDLDHYSTQHPVFNTKNLTSTQIRNEFYRAVKNTSKVRRLK